MARLTPLSTERAQVLLAAYGFELAALVPLEAGSVNSNFLIETSGGRRLFARIYEEQGPEGASFEIRLNEALHGAGIPVARPLRPADGSTHLTVSGKPFAIYERVSGEVLCLPRVTTDAVRAVGEALARVHLADLGNLPVSEGRFGFAQIEERLLRVEASGRQDLLEAVSHVRALSRRAERERRPGLPSGLIHGDLFRDNVLVDCSEAGARVAALLDFESASLGVFVYDLMVTVLAWCFKDDLDPDLARALVAGYHGVRPLSPLEQAEMVHEGNGACARFATTRLTDFSLRVPQGVAPTRDYRRFLARADALSNGALDRALTGVF